VITAMTASSMSLTNVLSTCRVLRQAVEIILSR
jgi:hypothetical protein